MNSLILQLIFASLLVTPFATLAEPVPGQPDGSATQRVRTIITTELPPDMNGKDLRATLIRVRYGPGEASSPHSHACPVIVYVLEGTVRSEIKGQPEASYRAGESFYEPPGRLHLISANASKSRPARFLAFFVCDTDAPLSSDSPQNASGTAR
jgi:quercetin dioxygenase-like cupin family protein